MCLYLLVFTCPQVLRAGIVSTLQTIISLAPGLATPWMSYKCSLNWIEPQKLSVKTVQAFFNTTVYAYWYSSPAFTHLPSPTIQNYDQWETHLPGLQVKPPGPYTGCFGWLGCTLVLVTEVLKQLLKIRGETWRSVGSTFLSQQELPAVEAIHSILRASAFKLAPHWVYSPVLVGW